ncbi:cupredoxin domain-containing protein [Thauera phenolivorans]|uniref:cupredoxin domain-containing protein n=1 Tax=Thauera phenolivorans TaxID=1792543 RepID=UPI00083B02A4|nr:cupredoxin family protein [Thauera phenolivorans]
MKSRRRFLATGLATGVLALHRTAFAHGGAERAPEPASDTAREQQDWGIAGEEKAVSRTIPIVMTDDMRFVPDRIAVRLGETVRFTHRNRGAVMHEMVLGTPRTLAEHAALMQRFPEMEHDEPWMAHVAPGGRGAMVWEFNRAGEFQFACLIPGHFQAGMVGTIEIVG